MEWGGVLELCECRSASLCRAGLTCLSLCGNVCIAMEEDPNRDQQARKHVLAGPSGIRFSLGKFQEVSHRPPLKTSTL